MRSKSSFRLMGRRWPAAVVLLLVIGLGTVVRAAPGDSKAFPDRRAVAHHEEKAERASAPQQQVLHPALWALLQTDPDRKVPVIVQKANANVNSASLAQAAGGSVDEEYGFIHSLRMTVPARALAGLAHNPGIRYISPDGPVDVAAIDTSALQTIYPTLTGATSVWNTGTGLTGKGITVAVIDSGVGNHADFGTRVLARWASRATSQADVNGHGTHVAGIIGGRSADGRYIGVAPEVNILALKVADDKYQTSESSVVKALQWVYDNRATYNIRAVNMSLSAQTPTPYVYSPLAAAAEKVWQSGVVVLAAAGNRGWGPSVLHYPPANDAHIITVGALDDNQTAVTSDDSLATFSSYGLTQNNISKPDLVAPGRKIVAPLAGTGTVLAKSYPDRVTPDGKYIRLSGTSMATPVVTGMVALMLQRYPELTPNEVKWVLTQTTKPYANQPAGSAGQVDIQAALNLIASRKAAGQPLGQANQGALWNPQINLLANNTSWDTTNWSQATYDAQYWEASYWEASYWEASYWEATYWEATYWEASYWESSVDSTSSNWD